MTTATIVHETPFHRLWRTDGNLRYGFAMTSIIIILNVAAILHMRTHKIPLDENVLCPVLSFGCMYAPTMILSCLCWVVAAEDESSEDESSDDESSLSVIYVVERLGHTLGFCIFLGLLYSISHLALYIVLPCLLWFVSAMVAPCCPCLWRGEPAWWNFVKQPQPTKSIV